ncbi:glycosyltransferase family protein [Hydrotalea sp.]|uniref:glycosyltransferase family protein n=1 Tax=Hydrotalea sp. TaxID=2881279 RepID=UPI003D0E8AB5
MIPKKRVLFISPSFFGYEKSIVKAIEKLGLEVDFFDERPSNRSFFKAIVRVNKNLLKRQIDNYFKKILSIIKSKNYSYFLLIKGEVTPEFFMKEFIYYNPQSELIFYTFDSLKNNPNCLLLLKYFNKCYSFDFDDVKQYSYFKLKHLFYSYEFENNYNIELEKREYDVSFIGTLHSNRYRIIKIISNFFKKNFIFFYVPAKWLFVYNKLFDKDFSNVNYKEVSFKKISKEEVASIFSQSRFVIDVQRYNQAGLTMRTFEVLASGSILITMNRNIKKINEYIPSMVIIIEDENNLEKLINEINLKTNNISNIKVPKIFLEKYHIDNWIKDFFNID